MNVTGLVRTACLLVLCLGGGAGCAHQPRYAWGEYQRVLYFLSNDPSSPTPKEQVEALTQDIDAAMAEGDLVPPGVRIHLADRQILIGDFVAARRNLLFEKQAYPESTVLVDRLLATITAGPPPPPPAPVFRKARR
jgi:hypothetical protein